MSADAASVRNARGATEHGREERGADGGTEAAFSLADVERLRADPSPSARARFAAHFGSKYDSLVCGPTASLANAILTLLVKDVEQQVRRMLAETIAASPNVPPATAGLLARDEIDVARPVLERSPVLDDAELADIVRTHAMQYALAVAGRERISERLAADLVDTRDPEVVARVVANAGARLSARTLSRIAADHAGDGDVQNRLISRPALPWEVIDQLVAEVGRRLEWSLVNRRRVDPEQAGRLVAMARDRVSSAFAASDRTTHSIERELRRRFVAGDLGSEDILVFLRDGQVRAVEAGIALLAGVDVVRARQLLYGFDRRGLVALCARAGFPTPHYLVVRIALDLAEEAARAQDGARYPEDALQFVQRQYDTMRNDPEAIAQWFDD